jgi:hypothetical protein
VRYQNITIGINKASAFDGRGSFSFVDFLWELNFSQKLFIFSPKPYAARHISSH